jgi:hypothetical protein
MNAIRWMMALDGWHTGWIGADKVAEIRELPDGAWWRAGDGDWFSEPTLRGAIEQVTRAVMAARPEAFA